MKLDVASVAGVGREIYRNPTERLGLERPVIRPDEPRQIIAKVEAAWREGLHLHPQGTCSPLTSTFTITNGFVFGLFGRYKAWRRILEARPWRAILADPGFRAEFRESVRHTALFNGNVARCGSSAWSSRSCSASRASA